LAQTSPTALARASTTATLAVHEGDAAIDLARVNDEGEPLDTRAMNSWLALIDDVDAQELSEVMTINAVAPFVLTRALLPALTMRAQSPSVVVSVTSREGQFYAASTKLPRHPHTNMAKAALNMLVRTCGPALVDQGVVWAAVDPGWLSEQRPQGPVAPTRAPPLTLDDGVARVLAPVSSVRAGEPVAAGVLWKDFRVAPW
jgi:NAD(P)-dependent dehydrogenase (short-subunit alcohol dehydrogenase family)